MCKLCGVDSCGYLYPELSPQFSNCVAKEVRKVLMRAMLNPENEYVMLCMEDAISEIDAAYGRPED